VQKRRPILDPKITYSPAILKNVKKTPGMVCPNKTTIKFENEITAITVKIYVFQSKIFWKKFMIYFTEVFFLLTISFDENIQNH